VLNEEFGEGMEGNLRTAEVCKKPGMFIEETNFKHSFGLIFSKH